MRGVRLGRRTGLVARSTRTRRHAAVEFFFYFHQALKKERRLHRPTCTCIPRVPPPRAYAFLHLASTAPVACRQPADCVGRRVFASARGRTGAHGANQRHVRIAGHGSVRGRGRQRRGVRDSVRCTHGVASGWTQTTHCGWSKIEQRRRADRVPIGRCWNRQRRRNGVQTRACSRDCTAPVRPDRAARTPETGALLSTPSANRLPVHSCCRRRSLAVTPPSPTMSEGAGGQGNGTADRKFSLSPMTWWSRSVNVRWRRWPRSRLPAGAANAFMPRPAADVLRAPARSGCGASARRPSGSWACPGSRCSSSSRCSRPLPASLPTR